MISCVYYSNCGIINLWVKLRVLGGVFMVDYIDDLKDKKVHVSLCPSLGNNLHRHKFMELAYVVKGEAEHYLDNSQERIKVGDYFVIDYQSRHFYRAITQEFEVINCLFLPELIDPSLIHCNSFAKSGVVCTNGWLSDKSNGK